MRCAKSEPFWTRFPPMATATAVTTALPGTGRLSCLLSPRPQKMSEAELRFALRTPDSGLKPLLLPRRRSSLRGWAVCRAVTGTPSCTGALRLRCAEPSPPPHPKPLRKHRVVQCSPNGRSPHRHLDGFTAAGVHSPTTAGGPFTQQQPPPPPRVRRPNYWVSGILRHLIRRGGGLTAHKS